jgi:hypothetical protein
MDISQAGGTNNRVQFYETATGKPILQLNTSATGGTETRPRNIAMLACIKY